MTKKNVFDPRYLEDILVSIFCALFCFVKLYGGKKAHATRRYLEDILVSTLCFVVLFGALWWKKKKAHSTPRYLEDILKISWFLSSVLCCAFWELCGDKKAHSTPRYLEDILVSIFSSLLCFLGALWW